MPVFVWGCFPVKMTDLFLHRRAAVAGLLLAASPAALAGLTVDSGAGADLHISATVETGSCSPAIDNGGVDFGRVSLAGLHRHTPTELGTRQTLLRIRCSAPMAVGFTISDDRMNSRVSLAGEDVRDGFGLGSTPAGAALGRYHLTIAPHPVRDGHSGYLIQQAGDGLSGWRRAAGAVTSGAARLWSVASAPQARTPAVFSVATFTLTVRATLQARDRLNIRDDVPLDGLATFTLVYL